MPLRAILDSDPIYAFNYDDSEWSELRSHLKDPQNSLTTACCSSRAALRKSHLGTKHFFHVKRGDCTAGLEGELHMRAKEAIYRAAIKAGFECELEAAGDGWRADALVTTPNSLVAFEVQVSPQSYDETVRRQERYAAAGVRCCWLFKKLPKHLLNTPERRVPAFPLIDACGELSVALNPTSDTFTPLAAFIANSLVGKVKFRTHVSASKDSGIIAQVVRHKCPACDAEIAGVRVGRRMRAACSSNPHTLDDLVGRGFNATTPSLRMLQTVQRRTLERKMRKNGDNLVLKTAATGRRRFYTATQCCPNCAKSVSSDALLGPLYREHGIWLRPAYELVFRKSHDWNSPHWCLLSDSNTTCTAKTLPVKLAAAANPEPALVAPEQSAPTALERYRNFAEKRATEKKQARGDAVYMAAEKRKDRALAAWAKEAYGE